MQPHCQEELEVEGDDVGSQAEDWQQGSIHAAQPHQGLVLYHLNHHLHQRPIYRKEATRKEKVKDYIFRRHFNEKPGTMPGCSGAIHTISREVLPGGASEPTWGYTGTSSRPVIDHVSCPRVKYTQL